MPLTLPVTNPCAALAAHAARNTATKMRGMARGLGRRQETRRQGDPHQMTANIHTNTFLIEHAFRGCLLGVQAWKTPTVVARSKRQPALGR